jgi:cold shock CspA family protein
MSTGTVTAVKSQKMYGFIRSQEFPDDIFFHASSLTGDLQCDETLLERRVTFDVESAPRGLRAVGVRAAA